MSSRQDRLKMARYHIGPRIDRLPALSRSASLSDLVCELDQLRRLADAHEMPCLSDIAHQIEALAAKGWSRTMADHYFTAMHAAITADTLGKEAHDAVMASVAIYR